MIPDDNPFTLLNESRDEDDHPHPTTSTAPPAVKKKSRKARIKSRKVREQSGVNTVPGYNNPSNLVNCPRLNPTSTAAFRTGGENASRSRATTSSIAENLCNPRTSESATRSTTATAIQSTTPREPLRNPRTSELATRSTTATAVQSTQASTTSETLPDPGPTTLPSSSTCPPPPPPPPYSPRIVITDGGSPFAKSRFVDVAIDLRWPDKITKETVERGMPESQLKLLTPVKELVGFGTQVDVHVSPESAKSNTKVHVDSSYKELVSAITDDIESRLEEKLRARLLEDLRAEFEGIVKYEKDFTRFLWMRVIQDHVYKRMSERILHGSDPKEWNSFTDLVSEYESIYDIDILTQSDLLHLRNSTHRETANDLIHPSLTDVEGIKKCWTGLEARLRGDGLEEEREQYERFYLFATTVLG